MKNTEENIFWIGLTLGALAVQALIIMMVLSIVFLPYPE